MNDISLVLFDCDGTLYDTFPGVKAVIIETLESMGLPAMPDDFNWRVCVGPPLADIFGRLVGVPAGRVEEASDYYREHYLVSGLPLSRLYGGMEECLRRLDAAGIALGVASSKTRSNLEATLVKDSCSSLFRTVVCPEGSFRPSKKEMVEIASREAGLPAERILMVGDTYFDAEGAALAGCSFAAALWGYGEPEDFDAWPCRYRAEDPGQLADMILG